MKLGHPMVLLSRIGPFSTLDSGLRDETSVVRYVMKMCLPFSTLDSGLRDETSPRRAAVHGQCLSVPSTRVYAMKRTNPFLQCRAIALSVPSTRVYAMKHNACFA